MKRIKIALSEVRWDDKSLPKDFIVFISSNTPDCAITQAIQKKCIQKFGDYFDKMMQDKPFVHTGLYSAAAFPIVKAAVHLAPEWDVNYLGPSGMTFSVPSISDMMDEVEVLRSFTGEVLLRPQRLIWTKCTSDGRITVEDHSEEALSAELRRLVSHMAYRMKVFEDSMRSCVGKTYGLRVKLHSQDPVRGRAWSDWPRAIPPLSIREKMKYMPCENGSKPAEEYVKLKPADVYECEKVLNGKAADEHMLDPFEVERRKLLYIAVLREIEQGKLHLRFEDFFEAQEALEKIAREDEVLSEFMKLDRAPSLLRIRCECVNYGRMLWHYGIKTKEA
jgi:hypothetical protein